MKIEPRTNQGHSSPHRGGGASAGGGGGGRALVSPRPAAMVDEAQHDVPPAAGRVQANDSIGPTLTPYRPTRTDHGASPTVIYVRVFENWPFINRILKSHVKRKFNSNR